MRFRLDVALALATLVGLALIPTISSLTGSQYLMTLFTRVVVLAIGAVGLNLILGYGGLISFGHAVYVGIGAYSVGIFAHHSVYSGFIQWPVALGAAALFALIIGALSLRTRGVYFIMITLAFAQMVYFLAVGASEYGGDDGMTIYSRSTFGGVLNLSNKTVFYYVAFVLLALSVFCVWRFTRSHFGMVLQGARSNERRMLALGLAVYPYRLTAFVISGVICGLSGILLANNTDFVSPSMMHWTRSGDLMIMVILGGLGTVVGPVAGAVAFLILEELLVGITEYWQLIFGPLLVLMAIYKRGGLAGLLPEKRNG
jgi:branched-chain amino acid transport system permease protein